MSIFARLFLLIGLVSGLSLGIVAGLLWRNSIELERQLRGANTEAGARVLRKGTGLLERELSSTHQLIVREKANKVESYLANIDQATQLQAALVRQFLTDSGALSHAPPLFAANTLTGRVRANPSLNKTLVNVQPYAIFHLAPGVSSASAGQPMNRLRRLGGFFAHVKHTVPGCDSTYFGSAQGFILGYPGGKSYFKNAYDPRLRPWYTGAVAPGLPAGSPIWIADWDRSGGSGRLLLTCARAVTLPNTARPIGVSAIDVNMKRAVNDLFSLGSLSVSRSVLADAAGRVLVSASALGASDDKGGLSFDKVVLGARPRLKELPAHGFARGFAQVAALIDAAPGQRSGIYWDRAGKSVFIYASIDLSGQGRAASSAASRSYWHYIVQLRLDSLLKPIHAVTGEMDQSTRDISDAIRARTQKSAAIVLALTGATLLVALSVAYFAARAASRPLIQMARVAHGVGAGDLEQQAVESGGGEIGELGRAINAMISGLRQRDLLRDTFGRFVAPGVVDQVLLQGGVHLGGANSVATIFFSDLVGFTTLAEKTPPQVLVSLLNEYLGAMTEIIQSSEGTLDKYIGDAIMAFWGAPVAHHDDAARACRAALEQCEQLQRLGRKWESEDRPRLDMRIGIETGEVIVGNVGSELKANYTALGDTVNFASRLEGANKVYGTRILIGEGTRGAAGAAIEAREVDLLAVVGKSRPVRVYELLGMAGTVPRARLEGCACYERALAAFRERRWEQAEAHLLLAQAALGHDKPSEILLGRIERCRITAPAEGWDGTLVLDHK